MEIPKPVELARVTVGMITNAGRVALKQLGGGAWGDLGERYGPAMGGLEQRPASIQFLRTSEIPDNIELGSE